MTFARRVGLAGALTIVLGWAPPAFADQDGNYFSLAIEGRGKAEQTGGTRGPSAYGPLACESTADAGRTCGSVWYGSAPATLAVTATPAAGYEFVSWTLTAPPESRQYGHYCANPASPTCELHVLQGSTTGEHYFELRAAFRALPPGTPPGGGTVQPGVTPPPATPFNDMDGDGVANTLDCNDLNAAIRPGAVDTPQDGVDQDCNGVDPPAPRIQSPVSYGFNAKKTWSRVNLLRVRELPANATVELTCSGKGCPFKSRRAAASRGSATLNLLSRMKKAKLRPGATLTLRITAPGHEGKALQFKIRSNRTPKLTTRTLPA
ncbi:putative metal-binding motif-containing protein [Solirubrobacter sp. CPCC 204708]|uniref:MopE-related protein n=1 Tax=Solirubrobacter deserti TaxID=2282478 RepID=A0ABT4RJR1_9ACTN|nr:MopE-related protein [Solirubrobacter deserti]MBE2315879.1 putative metal-binding motif-containing protein [Solirubrobacter deserti]MDA0138781.1 MopE-related protein [Solirubrobacter deserti]